MRKLLEITIIFALGLAGIWSINHASKISEFIYPKDYHFSFDSNSESTLNLSVFNLTYDFTKEEGVITFFPSSDNLEYLRLRFPSVISNKTTNISFFRCDSYSDKCSRNSNMENEIKKEFIPTPPDSPYFTTLVLSDFSGDFYPYDKITISFESDVKPNGVFIITQGNIKIQDANYGLNFILGDNFEVPYREFVDLIEGVKFYEESNERDIKLELEGDYHAFRIKATSRDAIFWRTFWVGLGASLIGSAIVLLSQFILNLRITKKNKKLDILNGILNGQIKVKGIGTKRLKEIKRKFK